MIDAECAVDVPFLCWVSSLPQSWSQAMPQPNGTRSLRNETLLHTPTSDSHYQGRIKPMLTY